MDHVGGCVVHQLHWYPCECIAVVLESNFLENLLRRRYVHALGSLSFLKASLDH